MAVSIANDQDFRGEIIPPNLAKLAERLRAFYGVPAGHIGIKGDAAHRGGYHRSRQFLLRSPYARDRRYSITDVEGNTGGHPCWCCAIDISLPTGELVALCKRLDVAVRAGRLEKVAEWYGNLGGDQRVDGYDNIRNAAASADESHLWHAHIGIVRKHADDDHSDLYAVLTGDDADMPMTPAEFVKLLQDPDVKDALGAAVKEARFGFDYTKDRKGWSIGSVLADLMQRPAAGAPAGGVGVDAGALADQVLIKGMRLLRDMFDAAAQK